MHSAKHFRHIGAAALAATLLLVGSATAATAATVDYFLKIDGIEGESQDNKHKNEIDVLSWSWGATQESPTAGARATKVCVSDMNFVKKVDKATPPLFFHAATGKHIPTAILTARKAGGDQQEYLTVELKDILVSSVAGSGAAGDTDPVEQVSLSFASMLIAYRPQKPDGSLGEPVLASVKGGC